jgi:hypothetical protein
MTDRELLEAAARAVGYEFNGLWCDEQSGLLVWEPPTNYESRDWNPLTDDGDALRLAVKLRERFGTDIAACFGIGRFAEWEVDPYAATRRAIVRAAAAQVSHDKFVLMFPGRFTAEEVARAAAAIFAQQGEQA